MNRRVVLIDQNETKNSLSYFAAGLGNEIYTLQYLEGLDYGDKINLLTFKETDAIMLVGGEPFNYLRQFYHYGIRGENYFDCSKLRRLSIEGGAFVKVIVDFPEPEVIADFMSDDFAKPRDFSWFKQKVIHDYPGAMKFIEYMDSLPDDTNYGYDYEGSGMALDKYYELSGASLCTTQYGGFISFTDIRHTTTQQEYQTLLNRLAAFLVKRMGKIWTYNMQYEFQVSHRMLGGIDLYNLCDASVFNILDGNHLKKYSLKWTANMVLQSTVWDTEFDRISEIVDSMLFEEVGKLKKDKHKVLKIEKDTFKNTPEWAELCRRYPNYINEFESLILEYWGNPFMCIPSDILGYYCNLDAFYTLMIYEERKNIYSEVAIETFMDNIRLAARLHSCGIPKWEEYRSDYEVYCKEQMAWGITYCAEARCRIKMDEHIKKAAKLEKYPEITQILLRKNAFSTKDIKDKLPQVGKPTDSELLETWRNLISIELAKYLLINNLDTMDTWETGIDEGKLLMTYGDEFADKFMEIIKSARDEVKMKPKIDDSIVRKRKILEIIAQKLIVLLGLDKITNLQKQVELEKYLYYEGAYKELMKVSRNQLKDINKVPKVIHAFGKKMDLIDYSDLISENYFKCKSPIENDEICAEFASLYKPQSAYLAAMFESTQQLNHADHFYEQLGITTVEDAYAHFMNSWKQVVHSGGVNNTEYPNKVFNLAYEFYNNTLSDQVKDVWSNFNGYQAQEQFFKYVSDQYLDYGKVFNETDLQNDFFFMRKLVINYLLYKKYSKILSTYIGTFDKKKQEYTGMFKATDSYVIENPKNHVMVREASPDEPGAVVRMKPRFQCMEKSSKRWSSGYHTIVSHSDIKSTIKSYPGCLLSYFDISSAEVKSAGYLAGNMAIQLHGENASTNLIDTFNNNIDVYIRSAKVFLGEDHWNSLSSGDQKLWRKKFKTVTLGLLYGLGVNSLAERLNTTPEEAMRITKSMFDMYPELDEYIKHQQQYPLQHDGCINTFFGDRLQVDEWKYYKKATTQREKKNLEARIQRLGVNLPIQGGTSTAIKLRSPTKVI